ncbi:plasmid transfer protein TraA [Streptomyces sp. B6B3]|uniref:plasmid transfer protein TraA n=1 Tax=Streptomyces sp. B6B3 TaxID=3153570 RepID=UPI00325E224C
MSDSNVRSFPSRESASAPEHPRQDRKSKTPRSERAAARRAAMAAALKKQRTSHRTTNRTVNRNKSIHVHIGKSASGGGAQVVAAVAQGQQGTPGSDFMSNEDIRAFSEHVRREARTRATERSMDAEQLQAVLRHIPDSTGSRAGSRARARRVSRHLKLIAAAEKLIARRAAALYAAFEREYESELRKVGKGRAQQQPRAPFTWG